ncbi:hypothetical protein EV586_10869 [Tumebacillus sp. BK434]|uniref:hypothetical protein n=1 Tax=Tumebacillus sp. BK434 TaxID=2512169 RepID=UPI0010433FA4|nr:hypothetical protein [Tumebacillus sp. BK434]TCP52694.1 hypothetical protein EV586_10869 [Tumebacillus sp. BK434]
MKLTIDHSKLIDAPLDAAQQEPSPILYNDLKADIERLAYDLLKGPTASYLISGYRGAGKSSFTNAVQERVMSSVTDRCLVFVPVNIMRKDDKWLRTIIRNTVSEIDKNKTVKQKIPVWIWENMKLLFERTFHDVTDSSKLGSAMENATSVDLELDLTKIGQLVTVFSVWAGLSLATPLTIEMVTNSTNPWLQFLSPFAILLFGVYGMLKTATLKNSTKRTLSKSKSRDIKSLYDDEIAEYRLHEMQRELQKRGIELVYVFDEFDKINDGDVKDVLSILKPFMLSGKASYLILSGQQLFYRFHNSAMEDDPIVATLFSKSYHVPLHSPETFRAFFENLVVNQDGVLSEAAMQYVDAKILASNRSLRKFINLIRQDLEWEGEKAVIRLEPASEQPIQSWRFRARVLASIESIVETMLQIFPEKRAVNDFYISQLYIWVQRMFSFDTKPFSKESIYDYVRDYADSVTPNGSREYLNFLCSNLLEHLISERLLVEREEPNKYHWNQAFDSFSEQIQDVELQEMPVHVAAEADTFYKRFHELDSFCFRQLDCGVSQAMSHGVFSENERSMLHKVLAIKSALDTSSRPVSTEELKYEGIFAINRLIGKLAELMAEHHLRKVLNPIGYAVKRVKDLAADFIATTIEKSEPQLIFEIKYGKLNSNLVRNVVSKLIRSLRMLNFETSKQNHALLVWFVQEYTFDLSSRLELEELEGFVHLILVRANDMSELDAAIQKIIPEKKNAIDA